ncbi:MAG: hypothetical protein KIS65_01830 [Nitrosomonas sp.]|nr:hypothetical protein [Nitrosomonas sp.]
MKFEFFSNQELPTLAWCALIKRDIEVVYVEHGNGVDIAEDFFVEGAWNGKFSSGEFFKSDVFLGSGAILQKDRVLFCPTTHSMDRLYSLRTNDSLFVSNSLIYLLEASGKWFDYSEWRYEYWFMSFLYGLDHAMTEFFIDSAVLQFHYCAPFTVSRTLEVQALNRPELPRFKSYNDYVKTIRDWICALIENAMDAKRLMQFDPLTTISSGYDSVACAVLAEEIGCSEAINIRDSRPVSGRSQNDSNDQIAAFLGLKVKHFSRSEIFELNGFPEAEFLASGAGGDDAVFALFGTHLTSRILFTGFLGDTLWGTTGPDPIRSTQFQYTYPPGATLCEFRLKIGFIHLPIPLLTYPRHPDLRVIANSAEMANWRIGGAYDRPIPRRIIEERGIARDMFATEKSAVTLPLWSVSDVANYMNPKSVKSLESYTHRLITEHSPNLGSRLRYWRDATLARIEPYCSETIFWKITKLIRMITGEFYCRNSVWYRASTINNLLKFHWAADEVRKRYQNTVFVNEKTN